MRSRIACLFAALLFPFGCDPVPEAPSSGATKEIGSTNPAEVQAQRDQAREKILANSSQHLTALTQQHDFTVEELTSIQSFAAQLVDQAILESGVNPNFTGSTEPLPEQTDQETPNDAVLATINGQAITQLIFDEAARRKRPANGESLNAEEKQEVMDQLIEDALLYQQAHAQGLQNDPKVQKVMVSSLLRRDVYGKVRSSDFTDEELMAYFDTHQSDFVVPAKAQLRRILIRVGNERTQDEALALSMRLYEQIKADPSTFGKLAGEFSEDAYRKRAGELGFITEEGKPGLDPAMVAKAFEMPTETLSEPFLTRDGYNIIYVVNKRDRIERDFRKMKGSVLRKVKTERLRSLYESYVEELRIRSNIQVDTEALMSLRVEGRTRAIGAGVGSAPVVPMGTDPHTQHELGGGDVHGSERFNPIGGNEPGQAIDPHSSHGR